MNISEHVFRRGETPFFKQLRILRFIQTLLKRSECLWMPLQLRQSPRQSLARKRDAPALLHCACGLQRLDDECVGFGVSLRVEASVRPTIEEAREVAPETMRTPMGCNSVVPLICSLRVALFSFRRLALLISTPQHVLRLEAKFAGPW